MNSIIRFLILFLCVSGLAFEASAQGYKIAVKVKGLPHDTTCYLAYHFGDKQYLKDTAKVDAKGVFTFSGSKPLDGGIYMVVLPGKRYFEFIVSEQNFSLETDTADYTKNMKVKGSTENTIFFDYLRYITPRGMKVDSLSRLFTRSKEDSAKGRFLSKEDSTNITKQIEVLNKEVMTYRENVIKNNPGTFVATLFKSMIVPQPSKEEEEAAKAKGDSTFNVFKYRFYKGHFWDNINFSDGRLVHSPIYHQKIKEYFTNLVVPHVDSINKEADMLVKKAKADSNIFKYTVWWITTHYETSQLMGTDAVYVHMVKKYYATKQAYWVDTATLRKIVDRANLLDPLLIGKKAPQLVLSDSLGKYWALHSVKAKYTIAYFWDPNCGHCQKETPKLYDVYLKLKDQGVAVFAVDIDRDKKKWIEYINKNKLNWINVYDPNYYVSFKQLYDIYSTPVIYILNEKKEIIAKRVGVEQVTEIIENSIKAEKLKSK
ncbi:MAG: DUF5106 domain-containing protein [Cytophagaceae bacterium]|nr:DUF5106 domain-containing protein [Cytophagaceae bacterium]